MLRKISLGFSYLAAFLMPFYIFRLEYSILKTNIFEIAVFFAFVALLIHLFRAKLKVKNLGIFPLIFLAISFLAVFFAADKIQALGIFKGWFLVPVVYAFTILNLFDRQSVPKLSFPIFASVLAVSIWGLLQHFAHLQAVFYQVNAPEIVRYFAVSPVRIIGPFDSSNFLAMFLVPGLFLSLPAILFFKKRIAVFGMALLAVLPLAAIYFTASRAGIIALVASIGAMVVYLMVQKSSRPKTIVVASLVAIVVLLIGYFSIVDKARIDSNNSRLEIYRYSIEMIKESPLAGIGLGEFHSKIDQLSQNNQPFRLYVLDYALHPHNLFLALWLNLGFFGLVIFILIMAQFFWLNRHFKSNETVKLASILAMSAILIHGLFDTTYFKNDLSAMFWLIISISLIENIQEVSERSS